MICWNFNGRCLVSAVAAVPAVASCLFGLSAPALAHARHHASAYDHRYLVRHLVRREAIPGAPNGYAYRMDAGAMAWQQAPQVPRNWNAWRQDGWRQQSSWAPRENGWAPGESSWGSNPQSGALDGMAAAAAGEAGVPASLVERVIRRESGGNPRAVSRGNYGLMQIKLGTARAMGYSGSATGLLDPQTNMTYAVKYLAGAYRAAGGNENRAVALYASGYRAEAPAQSFPGYAPVTGFGGFGTAARQPRGFARGYEVAEAMPGPFYNYAGPVHHLRHRQHRAG
jgi:soluble lytic murein transglycosylase-like protein